MTEKIFKRKTIRLWCAAFCMVLFAVSAVAEEASSYFDKKVSYDIYLASGESTLTVVRDVEILRFEEIKDKIFLVVRPSGFSLGKAESFIVFDEIRVIFPSRNLKIENTSSADIRLR